MTALLYPCLSFAEKCEQRIATVVSVQGSVEVQRAGETQWQTVKLNDTFCPGDKIRVDERSRAGLTLVNQPVLRLDQNTSITLGGVKEKRTSVVELAKGALHFFSRVRRNLEVVTGFVNAGVEGTEGFIRVEQDKTFISIFEGQVLASNAAGSLTLTSGQSGVAEAGKVPVLRVVVRPRDAVHWALYYLPVMFVPPGEAPKEDMGDPRFLAYRASQLLAVGRVDEAGADIQRALSLDPKYSDAYALQAIIFVVQNERDKALNSAQTAIETGPSSATARIAMSYARQAGFDLEGARTSVEEAVKLDPNNALAWARLAELWSSFGRLGKAIDAAKKAVDLDPNLSRTQMVLGFAYLTQVKTTESRAAFEKAIELDQADPLSRLGLGVAKIRGGDLQAGGREIDIAASLDPNNSLVRSYLGKAYFDKRQNKLARDEFAIAKELDPLDPTPWFYDAIRKQTINRPVEALQDMQKSIELNDNRAVYRSRLLLDQDLAARSASLGRIYNDLGFQQLGLVEGWKSVNAAPANYSAHRLLADLYAARPRHQIAKVSELLQSQLLQPLNMTPVQPQLAESNLFILEGSGPADPSFNEFNPLFVRNRLALQASGVAGNNDTLGNELAQSGIWNWFSYSLGQFYYETDGFRKNNDFDKKIYNVFSQVSLSPTTSLQAEWRRSDTDNGDIRLRFDPDVFSPTFEEETDIDSFRLGFHNSPTVNSDLIVSFIYTDRDESQKSADPAGPFESVNTSSDIDEDTFNVEGQYMFHGQRFRLIAGGGYLEGDDTTKISASGIIGPIIVPLVDVNEDFDIDQKNIYAYSLIDFPANVTWTIGASADFFDDERNDRDQFNPKFGIKWNPIPSTTLRAAAFRTLKRLLVSNQTIEPTQVAGFNQFFDDVNSTESWRYGIAADQKFSATIYGGLELSKRDLDVPILGPNLDVIRKEDRDEKLLRAYLYWTPFSYVALSAEYQYENIDRDFVPGAVDVTLLTPAETKTHRVPLAFNAYHPNGLFLTLQATYFDHQVDFPNLAGDTDTSSDEFWIADFSVGYRLPKRYGIASLTVKNLFDENFNFQDTDLAGEPRLPSIQPDRSIVGSVTLSF
jgi:tetratricopeptide (TPR) repeat protein